jgi:hypothetical protein
MDPYDNVVADCATETFDSEKLPNAALIALACNSHYQLTSALRRLSEVATVVCNLKQSNFAARADVWKELEAANNVACAAIAEAEENEQSSGPARRRSGLE